MTQSVYYSLSISIHILGDESSSTPKANWLQITLVTKRLFQKVKSASFLLYNCNSAAWIVGSKLRMHRISRVILFSVILSRNIRVSSHSSFRCEGSSRTIRIVCINQVRTTHVFSRCIYSLYCALLVYNLNTTRSWLRSPLFFCRVTEQFISTILSSTRIVQLHSNMNTSVVFPINCQSVSTGIRKTRYAYKLYSGFHSDNQDR